MQSPAAAQACKTEAAVAQPLMPQPQPQPQPQSQPQPQPHADSYADAQAHVVFQRAKAQRAKAEYERLQYIFAQAEMAADAAEQEAQQIRAQQQAQQQAQHQAQQQAQQAAAELQSPCDLPQQPSSMLVVGEELCADSIKDVAWNTPAQATPPPQCTASTRADKVSS
eukprot:scaffold45164_cov58-Phaeocystis_antarctica.AAC.3